MAKVPFHRIWAGERLESEMSQPQPSSVARIVMEATSLALSQDEWHEINREFLHALSEQKIDWLRTYHSLDRTTAFWELQAPDVHTVQSAQQQVHVPCDRIWSAKLLNPEIWAGLGFSTQSNLEID